MLKEFHKIMSFDFGDFAADDNDPGELRTDEYSWKDTVIFLVDYSAVKHRSNILKVISDAMRTKIINSPTDLVGVCFYNCDKTDNVNAFEHIYVWQDLQLPDAVVFTVDCLVPDFLTIDDFQTTEFCGSSHSSTR